MDGKKFPRRVVMVFAEAAEQRHWAQLFDLMR
jgi:hypothetical protein